VERPGGGYYFDCLVGNDNVRKALEQGSDPLELYDEAKASAEEFKVERGEFLLY